MRRVLAAWFIFCVLLSIAAAPAVRAQSADLEEELFDEASEAPVLESIEDYRFAKVATTKGTLNMRAQPKDKAKIVSKLARGTIVRILEDDEEWMKIEYKGKAGFVKSSFIEEISDLDYEPITKEDKGQAVLDFKKAMNKLGYLKSEDVNTRFDQPLEIALTKLQLMNGLSLNPAVISPKLQALMEWGLLLKAKTGYLDTATDKESGLTVSIFCWDIGGILYDDDRSVKVKIAYAAQAIGGEPPYSLTVTKSVAQRGAQFGDEVANPFSHIWSSETERIFVYAVATDAAGNTATACAPYRYLMPAQYRD